MSTLDTGLTLIRTAAGRVSAVNGWMGNAFKGWMPTGLYARALLIMIVPMVVLQTVVAFVFMERHWNTVTRRLSAAVVQDIASLIDIYTFYPQDKERAGIEPGRHPGLERVAHPAIGGGDAAGGGTDKRQAGVERAHLMATPPGDSRCRAPPAGTADWPDLSRSCGAAG